MKNERKVDNVQKRTVYTRPEQSLRRRFPPGPFTFALRHMDVACSRAGEHRSTERTFGFGDHSRLLALVS